MRIGRSLRARQRAGISLRLRPEKLADGCSPSIKWRSRHGALITLTVVLAAGPSIGAPASAETTLEKISRTGILTIGTRTGSPPFGFINDKKEWVGFSIDLVEQALVPALSKKLGKPIKVEKKESTPATRIPLLLANAVDLLAETMTDTPERRTQVDFSITFFLTGAQFLVKKGSPITGLESVVTKRVAVVRGTTTARHIREMAPTANVREFPDQLAAFQALAQGQVDTYTNDGIQLAGLKAKAPKPDDWDVVGTFYSSEPYAMAMRKNEADFKELVDSALKQTIASGRYFDFYEKWFGPKGEVPYPMTLEVKKFLQSQK
jgi:ABC-type amino acid transport substrate-binding protein